MSEVAAGSGGRVWSPEVDTTVVPPNKGRSTKVTLGLVTLFVVFIGAGLWFTYGLGPVVNYGLLFFTLGGIALAIAYFCQLRKNLTFANYFTRFLLIMLSLLIGGLACIELFNLPKLKPSSSFLVEQTTELTGTSGWHVLKTDGDSAVLRTDDRAVVVDFERMPSQEDWSVTLADPTEAATYHK